MHMVSADMDKKITVEARDLIDGKVAAIKNLGLPKDLENKLIYEIRNYIGWYHIAARKYYAEFDKGII